MSNSLSDQNSRSSLLSFFKSSSRLNSLDNDWNIQQLRLIKSRKSKDNNNSIANNTGKSENFTNKVSF